MATPVSSSDFRTSLRRKLLESEVVSEKAPEYRAEQCVVGVAL